VQAPEGLKDSEPGEMNVVGFWRPFFALYFSGFLFLTALVVLISVLIILLFGGIERLPSDIGGLYVVFFVLIAVVGAPFIAGTWASRLKGMKFTIPLKNKAEFLKDLNAFISNPTGLGKMLRPPNEAGGMLYIEFKHFMARPFAFSVTRILLSGGQALVVGPNFVVEKIKNNFAKISYEEPKVKGIPTLTKCIVCGGDISSEAKTCPHCGEVDPAREAQKDNEQSSE